MVQLGKSVSQARILACGSNLLGFKVLDDLTDFALCLLYKKSYMVLGSTHIGRIELLVLLS